MAPSGDGGALPTQRIEALSDGVFAIAMTLLVLELRVPEVGAGGVAAALGLVAPKLLAYALGFVILATLWIGQHFQFVFVRTMDRRLLWINLVFLLVVSSLPFGVALLGSYPTDAVAVAFYGVQLELAGLCLLVHWRLAVRDGHTTPRPLPEAAAAALEGRIVFGLVGYGVGTALAALDPRLSLLVYAIVPVAYARAGRIDRHVSGG